MFAGTLELQNSAPAECARSGVDSVRGAHRIDVERAVHHEQTATKPGRLIELKFAGLLQSADILRRDLVQVDVTWLE